MMRQRPCRSFAFVHLIAQSACQPVESFSKARLAAPVSASLCPLGRRSRDLRSPSDFLPSTSGRVPRARYSSSVSRSIKAFMEGLSQEEEETAFLPPKSNLTLTQAHGMNVANIREELSRRNLDTQGNRRTILERLKASIRKRNGVNGTASPAAGTIQDLPEAGPIVLDAEREYVVEIKGVSSMSSKGSGIGIVIYESGGSSRRCFTARKYLAGDRSVFEAEYSAMVIAMRYALDRGARSVILRAGNDAIVSQVRGDFPISKPSLKTLYWKVMDLRESFVSFSVETLSESDNVKVHDLAKRALATAKSINIDDPFDPMAAGPDNHQEDETDYSTPPSDDGDAATVAEEIDPTKTYLLQFDGGARGNPSGCAGAGMVLYDEDGNEIWCGWKFLDRMSNNAAEYWAILLGLRCARSLGVQRLRVQGDSELVVKQLNRIYRVKDQKLKSLWAETRAVQAQFQSVEVSHIFRDENKRADWLANHAMDSKSSYGFDEA